MVRCGLVMPGAGPLQQGPNCHSGETGLAACRWSIGSWILKVCAWTVNSLLGDHQAASVLSSWPMFRIAGDADYGDFDQFHRAVPGGTETSWRPDGPRDAPGRRHETVRWFCWEISTPVTLERSEGAGAQNLQRSPISKFLADFPWKCQARNHQPGLSY